MAGLPGGGDSHGVPTSGADLAAYAANEGFPNALEPTWWQGQAANPFMSDVRRILGVIGNTTTSGGTGLRRMQDQTEAMFSPAIYTVTVDGANFRAHKVQDLAETVRQDGIVSFCHG